MENKGNKETASTIKEIMEKWDGVSIKVRNTNPSITKEEQYKIVSTIMNNSIFSREA